MTWGHKYPIQDRLSFCRYHLYIPCYNSCPHHKCPSSMAAKRHIRLNRTGQNREKGSSQNNRSSMPLGLSSFLSLRHYRATYHSTTILECQAKKCLFTYSYSKYPQFYRSLRQRCPHHQKVQKSTVLNRPPASFTPFSAHTGEATHSRPLPASTRRRR